MPPAARRPYAEAVRLLLRDTVLGAVDDLVRTRGWKATRMADVAVAAGISRQTLYNEFGSRQELVEAYVGREIEKLLDEAGELARTRADEPHAALETAFELFLKLISDEPFVRILLADRNETGEIMHLLTSVAQPIGIDQVAGLILEVWPQVAEADACVVADALVRLAISHALHPTAASADVAADVARLVTPFVDQALGL
jgi:AcrR family transcriptional regulator